MDALRISCYLVRLKIPILQATISKKLMEIPCSNHAARNDVMATATATTITFFSDFRVRVRSGSIPVQTGFWKLYLWEIVMIGQ